MGHSTPWANADLSTTAHQTIYEWVHAGANLDGWAAVQADLTGKGQAVQEQAVALNQAMNDLVPHWKGKDAFAAFKAIFSFAQSMHDMGGQVVHAAATMGDVHAAAVKVQAAVKTPRSMSIGDVAGAGGAGAAVGATIAGPAGAVAGAIVGGVADYFAQHAEIAAEEQQARQAYKEFLVTTGKAVAAAPDIQVPKPIIETDLSFPTPPAPSQPGLGWSPPPSAGGKSRDSARDSRSADAVNAMAGMSAAGTGAIMAGNAEQPHVPAVPAQQMGGPTSQQGAVSTPVAGASALATVTGQQPVRAPIIGAAAAADPGFGGAGSIASRLNPGIAEPAGTAAKTGGTSVKGGNGTLGKGNSAGAGAAAEEESAARGATGARGEAGTNGVGGMGAAGAGSKKKDDEERKPSGLLVGDHGYFAPDQKTVPTVIGEEGRQDEGNPHK